MVGSPCMAHRRSQQRWKASGVVGSLSLGLSGKCERIVWKLFGDAYWCSKTGLIIGGIETGDTSTERDQEQCHVAVGETHQCCEC